MPCQSVSPSRRAGCADRVPSRPASRLDQEETPKRELRRRAPLLRRGFRTNPRRPVLRGRAPRLVFESNPPRCRAARHPGVNVPRSGVQHGPRVAPCDSQTNKRRHHQSKPSKVSHGATLRAASPGETDPNGGLARRDTCGQGRSASRTHPDPTPDSPSEPVTFWKTRCGGPCGSNLGSRPDTGNEPITPRLRSKDGLRRRAVPAPLEFPTPGRARRLSLRRAMKDQGVGLSSHCGRFFTRFPHNACLVLR